MRCNKQQIQQEMKAASSREELSSIFAFHDQLTLVSYVPKPGKAVIVLSSMHHDKKVDGELKNLKLFFTTMLQKVVLIISIILTSVNDNKIRQLKAQFSLAVYSSSQKMNFFEYLSSANPNPRLPTDPLQKLYGAAEVTHLHRHLAVCSDKIATVLF